jgi:glyoxylase-like metal-dependent hydrolase (beta-lactamase superfamily II)
MPVRAIWGGMMTRRIPRRDLGRMALGATVAFALAGRGWTSALAQPAPQGVASVAELTRLAEDVFVFRSMGHQAIFIVTDEGVIATDPISQTNPRAPQLYRAAVAAVTEQPVKYVVYSHDHRDHNEGGSVFAGEAQFVAQRRAADKIAARPDSQSGRSPVPTVLFDESQALELGGKRVELLFLGRNHSDNSIVLHYPARRLLFGVDFVGVNNLPGSGGLRLNEPPGSWDLYLDEWIESLARVESLDFDVLVPGHPPLSGTKADVPLIREYLQDSKAAFLAASGRGVAPNSDEMTAALTEALAPKYSQVPSFAASVPAIGQAWARDLAGAG